MLSRDDFSAGDLAELDQTIAMSEDSLRYLIDAYRLDRHSQAAMGLPEVVTIVAAFKHLHDGIEPEVLAGMLAVAVAILAGSGYV